MSSDPFVRNNAIRSGAIGQKSDWKPAMGCVPKRYVTDAARLWAPGFASISKEEYAMLPDKVVTGKAVAETVTKPPLGVMPRWRWLELRLEAIQEATDRYSEADKQIPLAWIEEEAEIRKELNERQPAGDVFPQAPGANLPGVQEACDEGWKRFLEREWNGADDGQYVKLSISNTIARLTSLETAVAMLDAKLEGKEPEGPRQCDKCVSWNKPGTSCAGVSRNCVCPEFQRKETPVADTAEKHLEWAARTLGKLKDACPEWYNSWLFPAEDMLKNCVMGFAEAEPEDKRPVTKRLCQLRGYPGHITNDAVEELLGEIKDLRASNVRVRKANDGLAVANDDFRAEIKRSQDAAKKPTPEDKAVEACWNCLEWSYQSSDGRSGTAPTLAHYKCQHYKRRDEESACP